MRNENDIHSPERAELEWLCPSGTTSLLSKLGEVAAIRVGELVANKSGRDQLGKTAWMFRNLHHELLEDPTLDQQISQLCHAIRLTRTKWPR